MILLALIVVFAVSYSVGYLHGVADKQRRDAAIRALANGGEG